MALPSKADRWLPKQQASVLAAVEAAGGEGVPILRLVVATGLSVGQVRETVVYLTRVRLLRPAAARPVRYRITPEGQAKIAVWHALRGDGQNRAARVQP